MPRVLARYQATPKIRLSWEVLVKVGRHFRIDLRFLRLSGFFLYANRGARTWLLTDKDKTS
jgi:hypothetical protein